MIVYRVSNARTCFFCLLRVQHEAFKSGEIDTGFIPKYAADLQIPPPLSKARIFLSELTKKGKKGKAPA